MSDHDYAPPSQPPPLLSQQQLAILVEQGHLSLTLPPQLAKLYDDLSASASTFFNQAEDVKALQYPPSQGTESGYYTVPGEKEYLTLRHGRTVSALDKVAEDTWSRTAVLLHRILIDLSNTLGIAPTAWDPILQASLSIPTSVQKASPTVLRMFRYAPKCGTAAVHKDTGLLTLCDGRTPGLQVWQRGTSDGSDKDGEWVDVKGPTVLVGESLRILSSNRVPAGAHRVVAVPEGRESIVFALRPSTDCILALEPFGGEGTVAMDEFWRAINASKFNINAKKDIMEKQKEGLKQSATRGGIA